MSYIRASGPLTYVEGDSEDYVFHSVGDFIEDYGDISNNGIIELLIMNWETDDKLFKDHIIKRLSEKLNVKLRDKPLTNSEWDKLHEKQLEKMRREFPKFRI